MALMPCRECGKTVSTEAISCPQCGAIDPTGQSPRSARIPPPPPKKRIGCLGITFFLIGGVVLLGIMGNQAAPPDASPQNNSSGSTAPTTSADICKTDWKKCSDNAELANNYSGWTTVQSACKIAAEAKAKYGTPKFPWFSFGSFLGGDDYPKTGVVTVIEPDAQFSNGYGAMVHSEVRCIYDLNNNMIRNILIFSSR
jgi:hypothetical protein